MADVSSDGARTFEPSFPFFLIYGDGSLLTGRTRGIKFVLACATRELGELVCSQFKAEDCARSVGLYPVVDSQELAIIARQLLEQSVTHMSWNATSESTTVSLTALSDFIE